MAAGPISSVCNPLSRNNSILSVYFSLDDCQPCMKAIMSVSVLIVYETINIKTMGIDLNDFPSADP